MIKITTEEFENEEIVERIKNRFDTDYVDWKEEILKLEKEDIYDKSDIINLCSNIDAFYDEGGFDDIDIFNILYVLIHIKNEQRNIFNMFEIDYYRCCRGFDASNYDEIENFLMDFIKRME